MSTNHNCFEKKGEPKWIRTDVPLLTSITPYRWANPAHGNGGAHGDPYGSLVRARDTSGGQVVSLSLVRARDMSGGQQVRLSLASGVHFRPATSCLLSSEPLLVVNKVSILVIIIIVAVISSIAWPGRSTVERRRCLVAQSPLCHTAVGN